MLTDAHCHFDMPAFDGRREEILAECERVGVGHLVIPGVRAPDWGRIRHLTVTDGRLSPCYGIHPWFVREHGHDDLDRLREWLIRERPLALGECGLDRLHGDLDEQMPWFESQVCLAQELDLPLVIHSVRTHDEVGVVLRRHRPDIPVLVHGFSGSPEQAQSLVQSGVWLGIGGVVTYERARKTRRAVATAPLEALVLETDAPDMPPAGVAKGGNRPDYLPRVLAALTELRPEPADVICEQLVHNVARLYGWE
ncbi:TatD DNase family protein [Tamilnaduibacter salinus]|uniref:Hydrolase TatD n=1 Tax=Tamilnaduibacter salinus TaxID=1484056 RepID=A0A2A2I2W4_9GAMM|nr:TatD family hydrolase [Tamilnaduibacter salinus]PAV26059.1 hydrolase TatD [Tamilnaduibacter salinus]PVY78804.1 TatD DNase family protein [Tamilnaduibacter salinus]